MNIATGSIWGKPTWGTWWTWDARLTSVSIVFVIFLGYLLLRGMTEDPERGARGVGDDRDPPDSGRARLQSGPRASSCASA